MCTMQAPHKPVPQPNLVPVSLRSSRITHSSGVAGGAAVEAALPFTVKLVAMLVLPDERIASRYCYSFFRYSLLTIHSLLLTPTPLSPARGAAAGPEWVCRGRWQRR